MPFFLRKKLEGGGYVMEEATGQEPGEVKLVRPMDATLGTAVAKKRFRCKACKATFAGRGVLSMHFARQHKDLQEDKDSWQKYVENLEAPSAANAS